MKKALFLPVLLISNQFIAWDGLLAQQTPKPPLSEVQIYKKPIAKPNGFYLPDGTTVSLKFFEDISSKTAKEDEIVNFEVAETIYIQGKPIILKGAPAKGIVMKAKKARMLGRKGKLEIALKEVTLATGERVNLRASAEEGGGLSVSTIALSALLTPLFLFMRGKNVNIEAGTLFDGYVDGDYLLEEEKFPQSSSQFQIEEPQSNSETDIKTQNAPHTGFE